jgi:hypothetical protein
MDSRAALARPMELEKKLNYFHDSAKKLSSLANDKFQTFISHKPY